MSLSKEKTQSLTKYLNDLKNKQTLPTPLKHKDHPEQYKGFLKRELSAVQKKLDGDKL